MENFAFDELNMIWYALTSLLNECDYYDVAKCANKIWDIIKEAKKDR